jgi:glycosyltransferase involved in cell wall biosynthesis
VRESSCGACVLPGSVEGLAEIIRRAFQNQQEWKNMGIAGREHVVLHYARKTVTNQYYNLIEAIIYKSG